MPRMLNLRSFTGSAGQAIVSKNSAYLLTDSRYWLQAREQLDQNWVVVELGAPGNVRDWTEWILQRANDSKIGMDARLISYEKATALNNQLKPKNSKLQYPPQNLVDLVWREKPARSREPIYVHKSEFTGMSANKKLSLVKEWIKQQRPSVPSYSKAAPKPSQMQVATLISNLSSIGAFVSQPPVSLVLKRPPMDSVVAQSPRRRYPFQPGLPFVPVHRTGDFHLVHRTVEDRR